MPRRLGSQQEEAMRRLFWGLFLLVLVPGLGLAQTGRESWDNLSQLRAGQKIEVVDMELKSRQGTFASYSAEAIPLRVKNDAAIVPRADMLRVSLPEDSKRARNMLIGAAIGAGDGIGVFSPNLSYRFLTEKGDRKVGPILTGGHARFCRGEAASGAKSGSGIHGFVRATVGGAMQYLDEPWAFTGGGSLRLYVFKRLSVEPEFIVAPGPRFTQWTFVPNVALDLADRGNRVTPYVIGGIGYFHEFDKSINYKRSEMAWNGGIGVRVRLVSRMFVSPEFRVGHISRVAVGVGWIF